MHPLMSSIVRIFVEDGGPAGFGFLISKHQVITCAHVVSHALRVESTAEAPTTLLSLDFVLVASHELYTARVTHWFPANTQGQEVATEDIAILELEHPPPADAQPVHLTTSESVEGHEVQVFGFPRGFDNGIWQSGKIVGMLANGWLQMETSSALGAGFSGTPVWDMKLNSVVGMVVAVARGFNAGFVIPSSTLVRVLPEVITPGTSPEKTDSEIHASTSSPHSIISSQQLIEGGNVTTQIVREALVGNDLPGSTRIEADVKGDVLVIEPGVVTKLSRDAAYERIAATADSTRKQIESIYDQTRNHANQWSRLSLIAAILGFLIVIGGVVAMLIGDTPAGIITAAAGVIPEVAAALFFQQMRETNNRVDAIREKLYEAEGTYRAIEFSLTTDDETQSRLKETIILRMLDLSTRARRATSDQQTSQDSKAKPPKKSTD